MLLFKDLITESITEGITKPLIDEREIAKRLSKYKSSMIGKKVRISDFSRMASKVLKELNVKLKMKRNPSLGDNIYIEGYYDYDNVNLYIEYGDKILSITADQWDEIVIMFQDYIKHEYLHKQQAEYRDDIDAETDGGTAKGKKELEGARGHSDEIEAYAMNSADELVRYYGADAKRAIKYNLKKATKHSQALADYYNIAGEGSKIFKTFLKKVVLYLDSKDINYK